MFFLIDLLCPQSGGKFSLAWLVATRGISRSSKKKIRDCDISNLCDEVLKMVVSLSNRPRERVSLALSARLINGVIKIYRCQVIMFYDDMVKYFMQIRAPDVFKRPVAVRDPEGTPDSPLEVVKRRPRKAKDVVVSSEDIPIPVQQALANSEATCLEIPGPNQAADELITLREEICPYSGRHYDMLFTNDFGDLGDGTVPDYPQPEAPILPITQPVDLSTPTKRKSNQDHPQVTPSKRRTVLKDRVVPVVNIEAIHEEIDMLPLSEAPLQQNAQVVPEVPQADIQQAAPDQQTPTPLDRVGKKTNIKRGTRRTAGRNRCVENDFEIFKPPEYECQLISIMPHVAENINFFKFWSRFMDADENFEDFQERVNSGSLSKSWTGSFKPSGQYQLVPPSVTASAIRHGTPVPLEHTSPLLVQPHQMVVVADIHMPPSDEITEQFPMTSGLEPIAQSTGISYDLISTPILEPLLSVTRESGVPPAANRAEMRRGEDIVFEETNKTERMQRRNRQKRIRDVVKEWNPELQGAITIEDVCSCLPHHTCQGIATTFYDLLCMQSMGYLKLHSKAEDPESIELGTIVKGSRIRSK